jgi:hypothetical protein
LSDDNSLFESIKGLVENLQSLNQQAVRAYTPIVEDILRSESRDIRHIEHTLDGLLDFCGYEPALVLYKKLCRHYFDIDPAATADYIRIYREMWGFGTGGAIMRSWRPNSGWRRRIVFSARLRCDEANNDGSVRMMSPPAKSIPSGRHNNSDRSPPSSL